MSVSIEISPILRQYTDEQAVALVSGNTVGQCLDDLITQYPQVRKWLFINDGQLHNEIDIYVNRESSYPEGLAKPVKDGDELHISIMIAGG